MRFVKKLFSICKTKHSCCGERQEAIQGLRKIAIVGSPNVGKSVMFNRLTGSYVTVSNYPGTTVEVSRGKTKIGEEEKVARTLLIREKPNAVLHVTDAKNLERMLPLTLQLIEARLPVVLVLNIIDEAEKIGMKINIDSLEKDLKIPVVATVSTTGRGIDILKGRVEEYVRNM